MSEQLLDVVQQYRSKLLLLEDVLEEVQPAVAEAVLAAAAAAAPQAHYQQQQQQGVTRQPYYGRHHAAKEEKEEGQPQEGKGAKGEEDVKLITSLDVAQLQLCLAFAAVSLYHSYLKTQGQDVEGHPVVRDLARVRAYMKKVALQMEEERSSGGGGVAAAGRSLSLNAPAANRILQFHMQHRVPR